MGETGAAPAKESARARHAFKLLSHAKLVILREKHFFLLCEMQCLGPGHRFVRSGVEWRRSGGPVVPCDGPALAIPTQVDVRMTDPMRGETLSEA